jgi:general L-amino acid transport system permease protein
MTDQLSFLIKNFPNLLFGFPGHMPGGLVMSILLAVAAIGVGFVLAVIIGTGYGSKIRSLRWGSHLYVQVFRGLPLILLLLLIHQLLESGRRLGINTSPSISALIALALYSSAYQAEIVRAGLQAVPEHLAESARLMGSTPRQVYLLIKLRYAWGVMLPAFTGQAISLFKDTSVVVIIGVADLMTVARISLGSNVGNAPYWIGMYLVVGFLYFCVAFGLSRLAMRLEQKTKSSDLLVHSFDNY